MKTIYWMFQLRSLKTPVKKKPDSPKSYAEDVVRHLSIITPESGRADATNQSFTNTMTSNIEDIDTSILDTSTELIDETPVMKKPILSPKSVSRDVIRIVTPKQGRADVATPTTHYRAL